MKGSEETDRNRKQIVKQKKATHPEHQADCRCTGLLRRGRKRRGQNRAGIGPVVMALAEYSAGI